MKFQIPIGPPLDNAGVVRLMKHMELLFKNPNEIYILENAYFRSFVWPSISMQPLKNKNNIFNKINLVTSKIIRIFAK